MSRKAFRAAGLLLVLCLLLGACEKQPAVTTAAPAPETTAQAATAPPETAPPETEPPAPPAKYSLNEKGEAVIDDVSPAAAVNDNACVFYEIFVGSFSDSNGDGIGDLRGIIDRMDYLNDGDPDSGTSLGIEGIWLTPIFQSPSYHKYDITNYYNIDSSFGSMADLSELIALCHERGVKIILDLPLNHTSRNNSWFTSFRQAHEKLDSTDPYYDFYSYYKAGEAAPAGRHFTQLRNTDIFYESNFSDDMPELNFDSPAVREAVLDVAKYYLELGVDGFRFDAAKYPYFGETATNVEFWEWYMAELRAVKPDVYAVAEVWDGDGMTDSYFAAVDCFNFTTSQSQGLIASVGKGGNVNQFMSYLGKYLTKIGSMRGDAMVHLFIANHDTDRAAGFLTVESGAMKMAANLYLLAPGSPVIYYGEEIGMKGSRGSANTDANRRLAMLWGDGDKVKNPTGTTYQSSSQTNGTVADQLGSDSSLYTHYKRLLMIRRANPAIARGTFTPLALSVKAGGFIAEYEDNTVCVLHNSTKNEMTISLSDLSADYTFSEINAVIGASPDAYARVEGGMLTLSAQTSVVLWPKK